VLPVIARPTITNLLRLCKMWGIVLAANMVGTLAAALLCTYAPVLAPELKDAMLAVSGHVLNHTWFEMVFRGVSAGFLIAAMVWLLPGSESAQFHVITLMTYLIAAGGFMHLVAGSVGAVPLGLHRDRHLGG